MEKILLKCPLCTKVISLGKFPSHKVVCEQELEFLQTSCPICEKTQVNKNELKLKGLTQEITDLFISQNKTLLEKYFKIESKDLNEKTENGKEINNKTILEIKLKSSEDEIKHLNNKLQYLEKENISNINKIYSNEIDTLKEKLKKATVKEKEKSKTNLKYVSQEKSADFKFYLEDLKTRFINAYLKEINECRTNPSDYCDKIENHIKKYIKNSPVNFFGNTSSYIREGVSKLLFKKAADFKEFANEIRDMQPLNKIEFRSDLQNHITHISNSELSIDYINNYKYEFTITSRYKSLYYFKCKESYPDPETCFILQLFSDEYFVEGIESKNLFSLTTKKINILNPNFLYVGINIGIDNNNYYSGDFLFAN